MNKALMIPIQPQHAVNILNGKKTLDLRTWIPKGYVGWVYAYVTKGKPFITETCDNRTRNCYYEIFNIPSFGDIDLNGKVAFRFWFDEFIKLEWLDPSLNVKRNDVNYYNYYALFGNVYNNIEWVLPKLCLTKRHVIDYGKGKDLYAWHIKKLEVFNKPKKLDEFYVTNKGLTYKYIKEYEEHTNDNVSFRLKKAPQRSVWVYGN